MSASATLSKAEYDQRIKNVTAINANRKRGTHCPSGHEYTKENTKIGGRGSWHCRICYRTNKRLSRLRKWLEQGLVLVDADDPNSWLQCISCKKKSPRTNPGNQTRHWELCEYENSSN